MRTSSQVSAALLLLTLPPLLHGQQRLPRYESAECSFIPADMGGGLERECGWFTTAEVKGKPEGAVVRLPVVIFRAKEPGGLPPVVMLHGGPGGAGGIRTYGRAMGTGPMINNRDVIIYDQRGAGLSEPKLCPTWGDTLKQTRFLEAEEDRRALWDDVARRCVAFLRSQGIDPAAYNTTFNGQDLVDLRQAMGISTWDVYSGSYGARLAQEAMRRDSTAIRSVVLASAVTRTPEIRMDEPLSRQRAFERVFAVCAGQPGCAAAFPSLEADFYSLYDELERTPFPISIPLAQGVDTLWLDGSRMTSEIRKRMNRGRRGIPVLINELRRGDRMRAAAKLMEDSTGTDAFDAQVLNNLVVCYDEYYPGYEGLADSVNRLVRAPFRRTENLKDCLIWLDRFATSADRAPVRSSIPTLILNGFFDDRTPAEHGRRIAAHLTRAYVFEFPNEGHGARPAGCHLTIMRQFLEEPTRPPDGSCVATLRPAPFFTTWEEMVENEARNRRAAGGATGGGPP